MKDEPIERDAPRRGTIRDRDRPGEDAVRRRSGRPIEVEQCPGAEVAPHLGLHARVVIGDPGLDQDLLALRGDVHGARAHGHVLHDRRVVSGAVSCTVIELIDPLGQLPSLYSAEFPAASRITMFPSFHVPGTAPRGMSALPVKTPSLTLPDVSCSAIGSTPWPEGSVVQIDVTAAFAPLRNHLGCEPSR